MLTSAYYYKFYRPYMISNANKESSRDNGRKPKIAEMTPRNRLDSGFMLVLNKSLNSEIVDYARNVSQGITGFKSSVRSTLISMNNLGMNAVYDGYEDARDNVEENLSTLVDRFNESTDFLDKQNQSQDLKSYSNDLRGRAIQGQDRLKLLGISVSDDGNAMLFNPDVVKSLSQLELHAAIGTNMQTFYSLHQTTSDVLVEPLSTHMPFKGLSYHFNYQLGRMVEDGFNVIEAGMIVDRLV
ncbi:MAG: hypothetical protein FWG64_09890 [Firmicutes bacterium]|nr:hypothetical protein [Bacillota bacterium]